MKTIKNKQDNSAFEIDTTIINEHLIDCKDIDNLIIKGHLIIEHCINEFIIKQSIAKIDIRKLNFSFLDKVEISRILGLFEINSGLYKNMVLLNTLRNSIAHNLKFNKKILNEFLVSTDLKSLEIDKQLKNHDLFVKNENKEVYKVDLEYMKFMICISSLYAKIQLYIDILLGNKLRFKRGLNPIIRKTLKSIKNNQKVKT